MKKTTRRYAAALLSALLLWGSASLGGEDAAPRADRVSMTGEGAYNMKISPPVMSSRIYYEGSETLGRVGHEAILKRDIFHQIRKYAYLEFLRLRDEAPEGEKGKFDDAYWAGLQNEFISNERFYTQVLEEYICQLLFYNDYIISRSKDEIEEQKKALNKAFDSEYLPTLIEQMHCQTQDELEDVYKEKLESSLDEERRLFIQQTVSSSWVSYNLGTDQWVPTSHDLRRYYEKHRDEYRKEEKVRWQKMTVYFSNHPTRDEAYSKIAYMGNAVKSAADLAAKSVVKVVLDRDDGALYFSRATIPCDRDHAPDIAGGLYVRHLGIYAYRGEFLKRYIAEPPCVLERTEKLEQLRALWMGAKIAVVRTEDEGVGVDTPEDAARVEKLLRVRRA